MDDKLHDVNPQLWRLCSLKLLWGKLGHFKFTQINQDFILIQKFLGQWIRERVLKLLVPVKFSF